MTVAVPVARGVFVSVSCGRWTHRQHRVERYRQREQWGCTDPGPVRSHSAFWGWKEKTSLRAADHASTPPASLLPNPISLPTPSPPLSLPPCFPSTLPASSMFQGLSQPKEGKQTAKENLPSHGRPVLCSAQRETRRKMKGRSDGLYGLNP